MIALAVTMSTSGLIGAAVIWVAYSLWENRRTEKRREGYWQKAYMELSDQNTQLRIQAIHDDDVIDAAEAFIDDRDWAYEDALREAVDRYRKYSTELPPPTGEPIT